MSVKRPIHSVENWIACGLTVSVQGALLFGVLRCPLNEGHSKIEFWLCTFPIYFSVIAANVFLWTCVLRKNKAGIVWVVPILILTGIVCFASARRSFRVAQRSWRIDGTVVRKYRSPNHGVPSIEIAGSLGGKFESIEQSFWDTVQPGDKVTKVSFSEEAMLNGKAMAIVAK